MSSVQIRGSLRRRWVLVAGLVAALLAGVSLLRLRGDDPSLQRIQAAGRLRVGFAIEAPYAFVTTDGSVSGESPAVAQEIARRLGVDVEWTLTDFDRLIPELNAGRFDLIAAGMFVNDERTQRVRFSRPTLQVHGGWLTAAGNPAGLTGYDRLPEPAALQVATLAGSVELAALQRAGVAAERLLVVPDASTGLAAVESGRAAGLALSLPTVRAMAAASAGRLMAVAVADVGQPVALAVRRDEAALAAAIDQALATYVGSAEHRAMLVRFGFTADDLPPGAR